MFFSENLKTVLDKLFLLFCTFTNIKFLERAKHTMKKLVVFVLFLIFVFLLADCNETNHYNNQKPIKIEIGNKQHVNLDENKTKNVKTINVAISTMISPQKTFYLYENLLRYIEKRLGIQIILKQRKSYQEVNDLLEEGKLDFAYVCSGAYVVAKRKFPIKILAAPQMNHKTYYQAYIIVNKKSRYKTFDDLKGKSFAFSDPLSNTGYKYVLKLLKERYTNVDEFFSKTIFTYAHDYSIQAVARGLVDGATVDGLVFDYLRTNDPGKVKNVKIIQKSQNFGIPPFVYAPNSDPVLIKKIQNILLNMDKNKEGEEILKKLQIEKFVMVKPDIYKSLESFN